ncbi:heterokaryon incompatibility protein-domain-containing protein [Neofusicoccum parvum]|nr:heterokaryon incompatibility protein-domain-containing protein [Neofusicoccum parvum]
MLLNMEWFRWLDPSVNPEICNRLDRMGDGSVLDLEFVKSWLQQCDHGHDHGKDWINRKNQPGHEEPESFAFMVIDVEEKRLVQVDYPARYVTLSYVWGQSNIRPDFETKSNLLAFLTQHGSLSENPEIPTVVKDAMEFVRLVGERYLWVDRFCIIQDDGEAKSHWIRRMDEIYANAYFTIIAASGENSNSPLPGMRSGTREQQVSEPAETLRLKRKSDYSYEYRSDFVGATVDENYAYVQRGWTFQEQHLSSRRVVFTDNEVICECSHSGQAELHLGLSVDYDATTPNPFARLDAAEEGFLATADERMSDPDDEAEWLYTAHGAGQMAYQDLVEQYTKRKLSRESDILNAFMGALSRVASITGWGFTYGLPGPELGIALYWVPCGTTTRRRLEQISASENLSASAPSSPPTWSWAGWKSNVRWMECLDGTYESWKFQDEIKEFRLARRGALQDCRELPENGEIYPGSLEDVGAYNVLCFDSAALPASLFQYKDLGYGIDDSFYQKVDMENNNGDHCGYLYGLNISEVLPMDLFLVPTSSMHWRGEKKYINCLVVQWFEDVAERVAVASIFSAAWDVACKGNSDVKTIYLA